LGFKKIPIDCFSIDIKQIIHSIIVFIEDLYLKFG